MPSALMSRIDTGPLVSIVQIDHSGKESASVCVEALIARGTPCELVAVSAAGGAALLAALRASRGEYIAFWPRRGELDPVTLESAVAALAGQPHAGAACGQGFLRDGSGSAIDRADIVTLLFTNSQPFLPAGVFRRTALEACGLTADDWRTSNIELDLCHRIAADFGLYNVGVEIAKTTDAQALDDDLAADAERTVEERMTFLAKMFSAEGFWGPDRSLLLEAQANLLAVLAQRLEAAGLARAANPALEKLQTVVDGFHALLRTDHRALRSLHRLFCTRSQGLGLFGQLLQKILAHAYGRGERAQVHIGYQFWNAALGLGYRLKYKVIAQTLPTSSFHACAPSRARMFADLYGMVGSRYEERGQIEVALEMWEMARPPDSVAYDSLAAQALLRLPGATDRMIADHQRLWVERHIGQRKPVVLKSNRAARAGKVRVGYHCEFMDRDTIRYMMRDVFKAHDRSRFEIYGYSPKPYPADLAPCLDVLRDTSAQSPQGSEPGSPAISDEAFISMVRRDDIDVFVELTGFSPGNRFRAMSERVAPVQVSFLNHTGSSHVPNVDYIITDEICTPSGSGVQAYYSEKLAYLPGCFFCFDYRESTSPHPGEPPSGRTGHPTFGCFGYGGKLNSKLIGIWARLLKRCPTATLYLRNPQFASADNRRFISSQFAAHGVAQDRLLLAEGIDRNALLQEFGRIDVSLDTWPYCGGNTIAEALWMGVPVVTLCGSRFSSRYGASLLAAAGCADLVGKTADEYIDLAARLVADLPRLKTLRRNLRAMSVAHGLGDSQQFAANLEAAYTEMLAKADRH